MAELLAPKIPGIAAGIRAERVRLEKQLVEAEQKIRVSTSSIDRAEEFLSYLWSAGAAGQTYHFVRRVMSEYCVV